MSVPASAGWLGGLGVAPFAALAAVLPFLAGEQKALAAHALVAYGATILSFLGGVHWGLAIATDGADQAGFGARLVVSVVPSLAGWIALLVGSSIGMFILAAAIAMMLWVDIRIAQAGHAPPWYPKLRVPLTCAVLATLLFGAAM